MNGLLLVILSARAQEVGGFTEVRATGYAGVDGVPWQLVERVRPEIEAELLESVMLGVTVEAALTQGRDTSDELQRTLEESSLGPLLDLANCQWPTHRNELLRIDSASDWLSVERLYLDRYSKAVDLRIGRQALNWGSARFFNPTDPFPEVLLTEPWRPRRGVNAVRATIPIGEDHQLQLVGGGNDTFTAERAAARVTAGVFGTDVSLSSAWRGEVDEGLVGLDVRGTLGVGYWLEGALHVRPDQRWEEIAIGVDYSFPVLQTLVLTAQYYRNGRESLPLASGLASGIEPPTCAVPSGEGPSGEVAAEPADPDPFPPAVRGRDYGLLSAALAVSRDVSVNAAVLHNIGDGTGYAFPTVSVAPTGFLQLSLAVQVPYGLSGPGEFRPDPDSLVLDEQDLVSLVSPGEDPAALPDLEVDLSGLVPAATATFWTRLNF